MNLKLVSACAVLTLVMGCQPQDKSDTVNVITSTDICDSQDKMLGGWERFDATPDVQKAMAFVLTKMDTPATFKQITDVHAQIVSGVNYAIEYELDDASVWNTIVYRNLEAQYTLAQSPRKGRFCKQ